MINKCKKHPEYDGKRKPKVLCYDCMQIFLNKVKQKINVNINKQKQKKK